MKYLLLLLSFNAYAHKYTIDYTNGKGWAQQGIEADTLEGLSAKVGKFISKSRIIRGEYNDVAEGAFHSKVIRDELDVESTVYYHPSNFSFSYEDLTPVKAEAKTKRLKHQGLRDIARGKNGQTKRRLNIKEINEYLFE